MLHKLYTSTTFKPLNAIPKVPCRTKHIHTDSHQSCDSYGFLCFCYACEILSLCLLLFLLTMALFSLFRFFSPAFSSDRLNGMDWHLFISTTRVSGSPLSPRHFMPHQAHTCPFHTETTVYRSTLAPSISNSEASVRPI